MFQELYDSLDRAEKEIALHFRTDDDFVSALRILVQNRITHEIPGGNAIILNGSDLSGFKNLLPSHISPDKFPVKPASEVPPKERAKLRRRYLRL